MFIFQGTLNIFFQLSGLSDMILSMNCGVTYMSVSYKKLWKLLIDKDMKKRDLIKKAGISHASIAKLGKNENVTTGVLVKICSALECDIGDIMEVLPDKE